MAKKMKKGGGHSGLTGSNVMDPGTGVNQDGFNLPSHVTSYNEGECSEPYVGREDELVPAYYGRKGKSKGY